MKVELENIRLAKSALTDKVFAGITAKGKNNLWLHAHDVTNDFLSCVIDVFNGSQTIITSSDGKKYEIVVKEITGDEVTALKQSIGDLAGSQTEERRYNVG